MYQYLSDLADEQPTEEYNKETLERLFEKEIELMDKLSEVRIQIREQLIKQN